MNEYTFIDLKFPTPDRDTLISMLQEVPICGRMIAPRRAYACAVCGRRIGPIGRLPCLGFPTCDARDCELCATGGISKVFRGSPYGTPLQRTTLGTFARVIDLPTGRVAIQRQPVVSRAEALVEAFLDLLAWQRAWDAFERWSNPVAYREGRVHLLPPRRLDDVLAIRASAAPIRLDPTQTVQNKEDRAIIQRFRAEGENTVLISLGKIFRKK